MAVNLYEMAHAEGDLPTFQVSRSCHRDPMQLTVDEYREGFRNRTLAFCLPAAHAEFSNDFLDEFSERLLKVNWRELSMVTGVGITALLAEEASEQEVVAEILEHYGVDVSDLPGLPLWEVVRRCVAAEA